MKTALLSELEDGRLTFHMLLDSLSDEELQKVSDNPPWTNKQILFHMVFGFFLLPSLIVIVLLFGRLPRTLSKLFAALLNLATRPFNVINSLGPQGGGRLFTRKGLSKVYDVVFTLIVWLLQLLPEDELKRGMHYPTKWDPLFSDYMTLTEILRFPMRHFYFHVGHIARQIPLR
jgi:hypothetical protein